MLDILHGVEESDSELLIRLILDEDLVKVAVHKVDAVGDVKLGNQDLILALHCLALLLLDNVPNLSNLALAGAPHLDKTLREDLVTEHCESAGCQRF